MATSTGNKRSRRSLLRPSLLSWAALLLVLSSWSCAHAQVTSSSSLSGTGEEETKHRGLKLAPNPDLAAAINDLDYQEGDHKLLLVGIFCRARDAARRQVLRATNHRLAPRGVDVFFVVGQSPHGEEEGDDITLASEWELYKDIYRMPVPENMNRGKSYAFFVSVWRRLPNYSYYMKADIDSYILYHHLAAAVNNLPRDKAYYGILSKFEDENYPFMSGMGHVLSADLVQLLSECGVRCDEMKDGYEDKVTGAMLGMLAGDGISYIDAHRGDTPFFYQLEKSRYGHKVHSDTILIHSVKSSRTWLQLHIAMMDALAPHNLQAAIERDVTASPGTTIPGVKEGIIEEFSAHHRVSSVQ